MEAEQVHRLKQAMELNDSSSSLEASTHEGWETVVNPLHTDYNKVLTNHAFVDKSLLIKTFFEDKCSTILITTPSGFGKTTNINMMKMFLQIVVNENGEPICAEETDNYELFVDHNLKITEEKEFMNSHFGNHPVIHLNFQCCATLPANSLEHYLIFKIFIQNCFKEHAYLLKSSKLDILHKETLKNYLDECVSLKRDDMVYSLKFLAEILYKHFQRKVVVLIDCYEAPISLSLISFPEYLEEYVFLLKSFLRNLNTKQIERTLITGTIHATYYCLYDVIDLKWYMFWEDHQYVPFYGLSTSEVNKNLAKHSATYKQARTVYKLYRGYHNLNGSVIYNTFYVINFLQNMSTEFDRCYQDFTQLNLSTMLRKLYPATVFSAKSLFEDNSVKVSLKANPLYEEIEQLKNLFHASQERPIKYKDDHATNTFFSMLLQVGFLTPCLNVPKSEKDGAITLEVQLPNKNMELELQVQLKIDNEIESVITSYEILQL